jgi:hypothetical protein
VTTAAPTVTRTPSGIDSVGICALTAAGKAAAANAVANTAEPNLSIGYLLRPDGAKMFSRPITDSWPFNNHNQHQMRA